LAWVSGETRSMSLPEAGLNGLRPANKVKQSQAFAISP